MPPAADIKDRLEATAKFVSVDDSLWDQALSARLAIVTDVSNDATQRNVYCRSMQHRLKIRRDGADAWLLSDASTGTEVGGVQYEHSRDGNHYQAWLLVDGARRTLDDPLPQLAMAARTVEVARENRHGATKPPS